MNSLLSKFFIKRKFILMNYAVEELKSKYFKKSLTGLGNIILKLDNLLGTESEFGKRYSDKKDIIMKSEEKKIVNEKTSELEKTENNSNQEKKDIKEKKEKKEKNENKESKPKNDDKNNNSKKDENILKFEDIDLRVAQIEKIVEMEGSDNLYHCFVNVGEGNLRTIGCGLRKYGVSKEEFTKDKIVVFANLKEKKLASIMSQGMILSASNKEGTQFELIRPPKDSKVGDNVYLDLEKNEPKENFLECISANKFTKAMPLFSTNDNLECCFSNCRLRTKDGSVVVPTLKNSPIS